MKRVLNFTAVTVSSAVFLVCGEVIAATQKVGNYTWTYRIINGSEAEIYGTLGNPGSKAASPEPTGAVTIPSTLGGMPVTSIGNYSVYTCRGLTGVTIPDSVTSIGQSAFSECTSLTGVTIPDSVTSIGDFAFRGCTSLTGVTIPDSVTSIGYSAFNGCRGLTSVSLGDGLTYIGTNAFSSCSSLTSVTIPDSVRIVDKSAFSYCTKLKSVTIPNSGRSIEMDAFNNCNSLWTEWYRLLADGRAYNLTQTAGDRAIADLTVSDDIALDSFVLKDGKVYDSVLYIHNNADHEVKVTLPANGTYKTFKGAKPLTLPAHSTNILTITRVARGNADGNVFFVMRQELETVQ